MILLSVCGGAKGAAATTADDTPLQRRVPSGTGFHPFQASSGAAAKTETAKKSGEAGRDGKGGSGKGGGDDNCNCRDGT
jgi:hypothetical protein